MKSNNHDLKVGDTVKIKSLAWYEKHKNDDQGRMFIGGKRFRPDMAVYCGKIAKITIVYKYAFMIDIDPNHFYTAEMFEDKINKH